ncbi:MAG: histone deacetylase family protein, partial [Amphiplicatus sp.]
MTTLLYSHPSFGAHETPPGHVERPARHGAVLRALDGEAFSSLLRREAPRAAAAVVERVHSDRYRKRIEAAAPEDALVRLDPDTFMGPHSLDASLRAVGAGAAAVDALYAGEATNAFIAARPPGHHAEPERAMGFCLFSTAAATAMHARAAHGARRVAVVDFDVHHGNGT